LDFIARKPEEYRTPVMTKTIPKHCGIVIFTPSIKEISIVTTGTKLMNKDVLFADQYIRSY